MKLLSFELPGLSGFARGRGSTGVAVEADVVVDVGGEGRVGWRKPPGPRCDSAAEVMACNGESRWDIRKKGT